MTDTAECDDTNQQTGSRGKETDVVYISLSMVELRRPWFDYLSQIIKLERKKKTHFI